MISFILLLNLVLSNSDSVPSGELISLAKPVNQIYGNPCMQSQRTNLVRYAIKIQTTREGKKVWHHLEKKTFLTKEKVFWKNIMF